MLQSTPENLAATTESLNLRESQAPTVADVHVNPEIPNQDTLKHANITAVTATALNTTPQNVLLDNSHNVLLPIKSPFTSVRALFNGAHFFHERGINLFVPLRYQRTLIMEVTEAEAQAGMVEFDPARLEYSSGELNAMWIDPKSDNSINLFRFPVAWTKEGILESEVAERSVGDAHVKNFSRSVIPLSKLKYFNGDQPRFRFAIQVTSGEPAPVTTEHDYGIIGALFDSGFGNTYVLSVCYRTDSRKALSIAETDLNLMTKNLWMNPPTTFA